MKLLSVIVSFTLVLSSNCNADVRDSVVSTGGCSGVVVRGNLILTAEHCQHTAGRATISGQTVRYTRIYEPEKNSIDECVVLKAHGDILPPRNVARTPPRVGDKVHSWGYPSGKLTRVAGKVTSVDSMVHCDFQIWEGHSGGPLFNASGEVIGLASSRNLRSQKPGSHWIPLSSIRTSLAKVAPKPVVYLFSWEQCVPCQRYKAHYAEMRKSMDLRVVEFGTKEYVEAANECKKYTGRTVEAVPTLWVARTRSVTSGTKFVVGPAVNVVSIVTWVLRSAASLIVGRISDRRDEREIAEPPVPPAEESAPTPISAPDYSSVTIVLLLAKEDVGYIRGKVREKAIGAAVSGPLRRRVDNAIGSSAKVLIVSERLSPGRYSAVISAAKTSIDRFGLIVLIAKRDLGIVKGIGLKVAEKIATGKLANAPVDVVFQRSHPADYQAISAAIGVVETRPEVTPSAPTPIAAPPSLEDIKGVVSAAVAEKFKEKLLAAVAPEDDDDDDDGVKIESVNTGMLGMLLLGAIGFAVSHLKKSSPPSGKKK